MTEEGRNDAGFLRALRLSMPGAALLSLPVCIHLRWYFSSYLSPSLSPFPTSGLSTIALALGLAALASISMVTCGKAILACGDYKGRSVVIAMLSLFNLAAMLVAGVCLLVITLLLFEEFS